MQRCKSGIPIFFPATLVEGEDSTQLDRIREELRATLHPADGIERMWSEKLSTQIWSHRRHLAMEAKLDARLMDCGTDKKTDAEFGILLNMRARVAGLIEADEERFRASLRAIQHHREFFLRAEKVVALQTARRRAGVEGRVSPSQPKARRKRRHEAADETAPSLVPEQEGDLESEEAVAKTESSVGDEGTPADEAEEGAEADGEGDGAAAGDNEASDEEGRV